MKVSFTCSESKLSPPSLLIQLHDLEESVMSPGVSHCFFPQSPAEGCQLSWQSISWFLTENHIVNRRIGPRFFSHLTVMPLVEEEEKSENEEGGKNKQMPKKDPHRHSFDSFMSCICICIVFVFVLFRSITHSTVPRFVLH